MLTRLNGVMVPGMEIIDYRILPDDAKNAMSCVAAADYCLTFREKHTPLDTFGMTSAAYLKGFEEFLQQESIVIITLLSRQISFCWRRRQRFLKKAFFCVRYSPDIRRIQECFRIFSAVKTYKFPDILW